MPADEQYRRQVALLVRTLPHVAQEKCFALKGGTAINLFDVRDLLANEGIDTRLRNAFIVYLISHDRPMAEVLVPTRHDVSKEFARGFVGTTEVPVKLEDLVQTREDLIADIVGRMPDTHRRFLLSFKKGEPDWSLLDVPTAKTLPAVCWKLKNLSRMDAPQRAKSIARLEEVLTQKG